MEINRRIRRIIDHYQLEQKEFAKFIGVTNSTISVTVNELKPAGAKVILNILEKYPNISSEWLIRGRGNMFLEESDFDKSKKDLAPITRTEYQDLLQDIKALKKAIRRLDNKE